MGHSPGHLWIIHLILVDPVDLTQNIQNMTKEDAVIAFMCSFLSWIPLLKLTPKEIRGTQQNFVKDWLCLLVVLKSIKKWDFHGFIWCDLRRGVFGHQIKLDLNITLWVKNKNIWLHFSLEILQRTTTFN